MGLALFLRHRTPDPFSEDDPLLAEEIAARAAVCADTARRYTRERSTALTPQRGLLPQRMRRQGAVDVASRYPPAGTWAGVGGDWFDVIPLSGARWPWSSATSSATAPMFPRPWDGCVRRCVPSPTSISPPTSR